MNEVVRIKAELDKAHEAKDGGKILELLQQLVNMPISTQVLQDTHIGATVNTIRKSLDHPEAVTLSKKVVKKWKKLVEIERQTQPNNSDKSSQKKESAGANNGNGNGAASTNNTTSNSTSNSNSGDASIDRTSPTDQEQQAKQDPSTSADDSSAAALKVKRDAPKPSFVAREVPETSSAVRLKFRQMITEALKQPLPKELQTDEPFLDEDSLAARIEDSIYQDFKNDGDSRYRHRVRSRICNLKDKNNPYLRLNVLRGDLSADRIAKMTAEEMASDELKKQREKFTREAILDHQMALTGGTTSSEIKCPACKKYDCSYNQMQTRSADEPMTTFCHCNNCGKRWKFC